MKILEQTQSTLTCKNREFAASTLIWGALLLAALFISWLFVLFSYVPKSIGFSAWGIVLVYLLVSIGLTLLISALMWRASTTHLHTFDKSQGKLLSIHKSPMGVQFSEFDLDQIGRTILQFKAGRKGLISMLIKGVMANILLELSEGAFKENRLNLTHSLQLYTSLDRAEDPRILAEAIANFLDIPLEVEQKF